jgi:hypothetical protein
MLGSDSIRSMLGGDGISHLDQKFRAALTSQPVTPGPTMAEARTVAPCTPRITSGAMICSPPPISTNELNPITLGLVSGSHVPLAYPSQRKGLLNTRALADLRGVEKGRAILFKDRAGFEPTVVIRGS